MGRLTLDIGMATTSTTTTNIGYTVRANSLSFTGIVLVKLLKLSPNQLRKVVQSSLKSRFNRLDIGEGKEVNIDDHCPRWKLLQQCIRYLGPVSAPTLTAMDIKSQSRKGFVSETVDDLLLCAERKGVL